MEYRCFTGDNHGQVRVIESKDGNDAEIVSTWGTQNYAESIVASSLVQSETKTFLAVSKKNGTVSFLNPQSGKVYLTVQSTAIGLDFLKSSWLKNKGRFITVASDGITSVADVGVKNSSYEVRESWNSIIEKEVGGQISFSKLHDDERVLLTGGKGVWRGGLKGKSKGVELGELLRLWDIERNISSWRASQERVVGSKSTWYTCGSFLDDSSRLIAGTIDNQVLIYSTKSRNTPEKSIDFQSPKAIERDLDNNVIFVGNGCGKLVSFDLRQGRVVGSFVDELHGAVGSIRSIARHPVHPIIASCGLDKYLRVWDITTRQLLSAVNLEHHSANVMFDSDMQVKKRKSPIREITKKMISMELGASSKE